MYNYEEFQMWHYDNAFEFESIEIQNKIEEDINNILPNELMHIFSPSEEDMSFKSDKTQ